MPDTCFTRGEMPETVTRHGRLAAAAFTAWLCLTGPGAANEPGIYIPAWNTQCAIGKDIAQGCEAVRARTIVDAARYPWAAVGRINFAGYRTRQHCTGALVGERLVLTAAHCLYDRRDRKWLKPQSINFLAGYQRGTHVAHARAAGYIVSKTHKTGSREHRYNPRQDWALIELQAPIGARTGYLGWSALDGDGLKRALQGGGKIALAGYPGLRKEVLSVDMKCGGAQAEKSGHVLIHRCSAMRGDSGGPLLLLEDGKATIVGVHSGGVARSGKVVPVSPGVAGFYQTILKALGRSRAEISKDGRIGLPGLTPGR